MEKDLNQNSMDHMDVDFNQYSAGKSNEQTMGIDFNQAVARDLNHPDMERHFQHYGIKGDFNQTPVKHFNHPSMVGSFIQGPITFNQQFPSGSSNLPSNICGSNTQFPISNFNQPSNICGLNPQFPIGSFNQSSGIYGLNPQSTDMSINQATMADFNQKIPSDQQASTKGSFSSFLLQDVTSGVSQEATIGAISQDNIKSCNKQASGYSLNQQFNNSDINKSNSSSSFNQSGISDNCCETELSNNSSEPSTGNISCGTPPPYERSEIPLIYSKTSKKLFKKSMQMNPNSPARALFTDSEETKSTELSKYHDSFSLVNTTNDSMTKSLDHHYSVPTKRHKRR